MSEKVTIKFENDPPYECPVVEGTENEKGIDIGKLRNKTGYITLDVGFANTGLCKSSITFIDGEKGILRYRGYPIEQLAESSRFVEVAWLLIWGALPNRKQLEEFSELLSMHAFLHTSQEAHFYAFPTNAHPMPVLASMLNAMSCYHPELMSITDKEKIKLASAKLMSQVRTIASYSYRKSRGLPFNYPNPKLKYCASFLNLMFALPNCDYEINPVVEKALNLFLILHADHGQNCSTSTARTVGSSEANLFGSIASAVSALWGVRHGGANMAVIKMLEDIYQAGCSIDDYIEKAKNKESGCKLMGFGHRVYKNFDPRAKVLKQYVDKVLKELKIHDPLLDIARRLEEKALSDPYFVRRKLYPNVDFYSGILLSALGIPVNMFTVMFAMGRIPGWIAHWKEVHEHGQRIYRPRQIYTGSRERDYVPMEQR